MGAAQLGNILIKNALLFDGSGSYPLLKDVAVCSGRIEAIGDSLSPSSESVEVIDASGKWLIPGMLDIHTHLDLEVEINPGLGEAVRHGTTTVVVGNCSLGTSFGAQRRNGEDPIVDCFARVESMPKRVLEKCVEQINWDNTQDYLDHFKNIPLGPNIAPLLPHSMLRVEVMGVAAAVERKASDEELSQMKALLDQALDQGYLGLSLDSLAFHYLAIAPNKEKRIPTQIADREEIKPLVEMLREKDRVLQTTPDNDDIGNTIKRLFWSCGRLYGKPLRVSALTAIDFRPLPKVYKGMLGLAKVINSKLMNGLFHFQGLSTSFRIWNNGVESPVFEELPSTRKLIACERDDREARMKLLNDSQWLKEYYEDMEKITPKSGLKKLLAGKAPTFQLIAENMKIDKSPVKAWENITFADVLARLDIYRKSAGKEGAGDQQEVQAFDKVPNTVQTLPDFFLHCMKEYDYDLRWWQDIGNTRRDVVKEIIFDENIFPGFNDSGAHITNLAFYDANLMTLKLAQEESLAKVAYAVRRLTRDPAEFFGVDAGTISVGQQADMVLINPDALVCYESNEHRQFIYSDYYESECLVNRSDGVVEQVYINGVRVWENGEHFTEALGRETLGRVLTFTRETKSVA